MINANLRIIIIITRIRRLIITIIVVVILLIARIVMLNPPKTSQDGATLRAETSGGSAEPVLGLGVAGFRV